MEDDEELFFRVHSLLNSNFVSSVTLIETLLLLLYNDQASSICLFACND